MAFAVIELLDLQGVSSSTGSLSATCELVTCSGQRKPISVATFSSASSEVSDASNCNVDAQWKEVIPVGSSCATFEVDNSSLEELYGAVLQIEFNECGSDEEELLGIVSFPFAQLGIGMYMESCLEVTRSQDNNPFGQLGTSASATGASIKLRVKLDGPLRSECVRVNNAAQLAFSALDTGLDGFTTALQPFLPLLKDKRIRLAGGLAVVGSTVSCTPIAIMLCVVAFPIAVPLLLFTVALLGFVLVAAGMVAAASRPGRKAIEEYAGPTLQQLLRTPIAQRVMYQTCPRKDLPQAILTSVIPTSAWAKLAVALSLDAIGNSSYLLPGLGEASDFAWGPIQALIVAHMFKGGISEYAHYFSAVEEILPFTDIIPSATLLWLSAYGSTVLNKKPQRALGPREASVQQG